MSCFLHDEYSQIVIANYLNVSRSKIVGISKRKVEENVAKLKKIWLVERVGGTRGYGSYGVRNNMVIFDKKEQYRQMFLIYS